MRSYIIKLLLPWYFAALIFFFSQDDAFAELEGGNYVSDLLSIADKTKLSEDRYWSVLLHYKKTSIGSESTIDDPRFFLAPDGKTNPKAELEETIKSLFSEEEGDENPRCKFVGRYAWLKEKLNIDISRLPPVNCPRLNEALTTINPKSAVMVYADAHINSPSSMFGHTFIRLDSEHHNELLSYAVHYSALANDKNPLLYISKGISGRYKGYFSIAPYHEQIKTYNDMQHRDMWEYYLNLSEEEVYRMLLHIWELKDMYSYYYFFDENCSFNILFLLEAARPSVHLTDEFADGIKFWVIPTDTLRALRENKLIEKVEYRPSRATRIRFSSTFMPRKNKKMVSDLLDQRISIDQLLKRDLSVEVKAQVFDLAIEVMQYKLIGNNVENKHDSQQFFSMLKARGRLDTGQIGLLDIPTTLEPDRGHRPTKIGIGLGYRDNDFFTQINLRPLYHGLIDADEGYIKGASIKIFDTSIRFYIKNNQVTLENLSLIDIISLPAADGFLNPLSWKISAGFRRELLSHGKEKNIFRFNAGAGFTFDNSSIGLTYVLPEVDFIYGRSLKTNYSVGAGLSAGIIKTWKEHNKFIPSFSVMFYELGDKSIKAKLSLEQNFVINKNSCFLVSLAREKTFGFYQTEFILYWNIYI